MQQATRIVAQIKQQTFGQAFVAQFAERLGQIGNGLLLELGNADVAITGFEHLPAHRAHLDDVANDFDDDRLGFALARDGQHNGSFGFAAHQLDGVTQAHALGRLLVDLDDQVAGLDASHCGRCVFDGRDNLDEAVFLADFDAESAELTLRADLQLAECVFVEVGRMGIQSGQHAADGLRDQIFIGYRFDVVGLNGTEHIGELTQLGQRQRIALVFLGDGGNAYTD